MLKGWRTIVLGLAMAVAPPAITYLTSVDWTKFVGANTAMIISGVLVIVARVITNTPVGKSS